MMRFNTLARAMGSAPLQIKHPQRLGLSAARWFHVQTKPTPFFRTSRTVPSGSRIINELRRHQSTGDRPLTDRNSNDGETNPTDADAIAMRKALSPAYQLKFTCKQCLERSSHTVSKQAYHFGTCVICCPKCKSQHLISDNLKIFSDKKITLEDIAKEHGQILKKGRLGADGNIEFYDDAATTKVSEASSDGTVRKVYNMPSAEN